MFRIRLETINIGKVIYFSDSDWIGATENNRNAFRNVVRLQSNAWHHSLEYLYAVILFSLLFFALHFLFFFSILAYSFSRIIHISITQHAFRFVELLTSCIWRNTATTWWNKWWMKRKRSSKKVEFWILSWRAKQQNNTIINIPRIMNEQKMNQIEHNNCCFFLLFATLQNDIVLFRCVYRAFVKFVSGV